MESAPAPTPVAPASATGSIFAPPEPSIYQTESGFNTQTFIIFLLATLLLLSFLGINIFNIFGDGLNWVNSNLMPSIYSFFGMVSYSTGELIVQSSDVAADAAKVGIDLAEGAAQSVGGIAKGLGSVGMQYSPELKSKYKPPYEPKPDTTASEIQSGGSGGKGAWCLVGDVKGVRNCLEVSKDTTCASGQVFPDSASCLKPQPPPPTPAPTPTPGVEPPASLPPLMDRPASSTNTNPPATNMFDQANVFNQNNGPNPWTQPPNPTRGAISEAERQAQALLQSYA